jgi:hypothetical protein
MATIAVASPAGTIRRGDTVRFAITGTGVISILGSRDGTTLWSASLVRGDLDVVMSASAAWAAHPGPLHCTAMLREQAGKQVRTVAQCEYEVEW